jgi:hypothetical protein
LIITSDISQGLGASTLISHLDYDRSATATDVERCLVLAKPAQKSMRQLVMFTQRSDYQNWLKNESESSALLVHGRSKPTAHVSPLSYLCARIAQEYVDKDKIIVLSYFCGLPSRDQQANATDLLCRMIGQLLSHREMSAIYSKDPLERDLERRIKKKDFRVLLKVFAMLIWRLRSCNLVIFCLIDSITKIETGKQRKNTESLLKELNKIVRGLQGRKRKKSDHLVFKLLVNDGARSFNAHTFFRSWDTINMADGAFGTGIGGLRF